MAVETPAELLKLFAMLIGMLGPVPKGDPNVNVPGEFVLKAGDQIVAIGDSITQAGGYLKDVDAVLASQYPELKLPPIINVGISGQKAEDLIQRFQKDVVDRKPALVTLSIGINDVWHRAAQSHDPQILADYWKNVAKMVDMAQAAGIKVVLLTPTVIREDVRSDENKRLRIYVEAQKQIAREKKCSVIDLHAMFADVLSRRPEDAGDREKWLTSDGVHMKPLGDALMAIGVLRGLGVPDEKIVSSKVAVSTPAGK
ncbi:MAG: lipolytic protein family [Planctomycetota bacterium]|nr:lipolytic protein family [Planctomycetota bacterium]